MNNDMLLNFFESNINHKKLRKSRLKRKLTIDKVSDMTGIPHTTLQCYETGMTKNVPHEALKKICKVYGTDYEAYYIWTEFPFFKNLSGILTSLFFGTPIPIYVKPILGNIFEKLELEVVGKMKIFVVFSQKEDIKDVLYRSLTKEEQKEYQDFKIITTTFLKTNEILDDIEKEEAENLLFITFMLHKIRKENKEKIIDFEEAEILN